MGRNELYATLAAVAVIGLLGSSLWYVTFGAPDDDFSECRASTVSGGSGAIGGPFTLVDETGATVTDKDVITRPTLIYFGYTFCPDVCPMDTARMAEATELLAERGYDVQPVFISIDPERDTPQVMAEFTDYLHPDMLGLTGSPEQVKAASQAYKTYYRKQDTGDEYYLVDHSALTYLVLPKQGFVEFFRRELTPEAMADTVACFIDKAS